MIRPPMATEVLMMRKHDPLWESTSECTVAEIVRIDVHWCGGVEHDVHRLRDAHPVYVSYQSQSNQRGAATAIRVGCQEVSKSR